MKILHVTNSYYPCLMTGGVSRVAYEMTTSLAAKGNEVVVFTTDICQKRLDTSSLSEMQNGVRVYYFQTISNWLGMKAKVPFSPRLSFAARNIIESFDLIHVHEHRSAAAISVCRLAKRFGVPYIIQAHGSLPYNIGNSSLKEGYDICIGNRILRNANKVIALTDKEKNDYQKRGVSPKNIEVIPNGIHSSEYSCQMKGVFRESYGICPEEKMVLYVGRLDQTKGLDLLLSAFSKLNSDAKLVLIGPDSGFKKQIIKISKNLNIIDRIILSGFISSEKKKLAYCDANVFVTPTYSGFPMSFLEACATGLPIVTTLSGDNPQWLQNAAIISQKNEDSLSDGIKRILYDPAKSKTLSEGGRRMAANQFDWSIIIERIQDLYCQTLRL